MRFNPRQESEWIRTNPKPIFSIRIIPTLDLFGLILIENSVWINPSPDRIGLAWIQTDCYFGLMRLGRIICLPFFIKRDAKRFSDWFGMIRIGSDTDIGIVLIGSELISIRYFRRGYQWVWIHVSDRNSIRINPEFEWFLINSSVYLNPCLHSKFNPTESKIKLRDFFEHIYSMRPLGTSACIL